MTFLVFVWADPGLVLFGALFLVKFDGFFNEKYIYIYTVRVLVITELPFDIT